MQNVCATCHNQNYIDAFYIQYDNHKWYIDEMDPDEAEERAKRKEEFKARYSN